jgi:hypothetical protein
MYDFFQSAANVFAPFCESFWFLGGFCSFRKCAGDGIIPVFRGVIHGKIPVFEGVKHGKVPEMFGGMRINA